MNREVKKYLYDIKVSIDSIDDYLEENRDFLNTNKIDSYENPRVRDRNNRRR